MEDLLLRLLLVGWKQKGCHLRLVVVFKRKGGRLHLIIVFKRKGGRLRLVVVFKRKGGRLHLVVVFSLGSSPTVETENQAKRLQLDRFPVQWDLQNAK